MRLTRISLVAAGLLAASAGLAAAGTGGGLATGNVSLTALAPKPNQVATGPALALHVLASGYRLDANYAGTPNLAGIGHYHEILDGQLVDMTPLQDPNRDTVSLVGVTPGKHVLTLVPARNDHSMIMPKAVAIPFLYKGPFRPQPAGYAGSGTPSIAIAAPAAGSTVGGHSFQLEVSASNFVLSGDSFGKSLVAGEGHWHVFVDKVDMSHMLTMASSDTQTVPLKGVEPGRHTFYALLVDNHHMPLKPMAMSAVSLIVR